MTFGLDDYGLDVLGIFLLLIPVAFYAMGISEGRKGRYLFLAGLALHMVSILQRWLVLGRIPLAEKHDSISFMALCTAIVYFFSTAKKDLRELSLSAIPMIAVFVLIAMGHRTVDIISPFMKSPWFYLHVFFYFLSYAFLGISACCGLHYTLGAKGDYEQLQYKCAVHGWIMLSLSLFAGSVWFYLAYGTYWLWTSKELWITITWLYYGLYLHARLMRGLRGRPASIIGFLGFAVALFTYFGVGTIIKSPPTQF
jgi:ABC-type transport system involved in cytochrome c biogenesis permease subunit